MIVALSLVLLPLQESLAETEVVAEVAHCLQHEGGAAETTTHHDRQVVNHCCAPHFCHATHGYALLNEAEGSFSLSPIIVLRLASYNTAVVVSRPLTPPFHPPKA